MLHELPSNVSEPWKLIIATVTAKIPWAAGADETIEPLLTNVLLLPATSRAPVGPSVTPFPIVVGALVVRVTIGPPFMYSVVGSDPESAKVSAWLEAMFMLPVVASLGRPLGNRLLKGASGACMVENESAGSWIWRSDPAGEAISIVAIAPEVLIIAMLLRFNCGVVMVMLLSLLTVTEFSTVTLEPEIFSVPPFKFKAVAWPGVTD